MTQVMTIGQLLRSRELENSHNVQLEVVRPGRRAKVWRVVPAKQLDRHVREWAELHGVKL